MKKVLAIVLSVLICFLASCMSVQTENTTKPQGTYTSSTTTNAVTTTGGNNTTSSFPSSTATTSTPTTIPDEEVEFKITLTLRGEAYYDPAYDYETAIEVIWTNISTGIEKRAKIDEYGSARTTGLVGEFNVHLSKTPTNYTYDPNITVVSNTNPVAEIELIRIVKLDEKRKNDLYGNIIKIENITVSDPNKKNISYCYEATLKKSTDIKYYQFSIKSSGSYTIESMVDVYDNTINPIVMKYVVGPEALANFEAEIDDGGVSLLGGFTKNFKYQVDLDKDFIGNVAKFGIKADVKEGMSWPDEGVKVTFKITYVDPYVMEQAKRIPVFANDLYYKRDENGNIIKDSNGNPELNYVKITSDSDLYFPVSYSCVDNSGTTLHYPYYWNNMLDPSFSEENSFLYLRARYSLVDGEYVQDPSGEYILKETIETTAGNTYQNFGNFSEWRKGSNLILDVNQNGEEVIYYNEDDGYYHYNYNGEDRIVCVKITSPSIFIESSLTHIEDPGNGALQSVVINKQLYNYKRFIEAEYASVCNSDGVCYVTKELKEFLQYFSNSQGYFFDGNGWCEVDGVFASEDNQWLFACGFYLD